MVVSQAIDMHTLKPDPRQSDRLRGDTMKWEQVRRLASVASRYERDELLHTLPCYKMVEAAGIEPAFSVLQTDVSPLSLNLREWHKRQESNLHWEIWSFRSCR